MLAIHLFFLVTKAYYDVSSTSTNILCVNMEAIYTFERNSKRIPAGAKSNNEQQVLWQVKRKVTSLHLLHHVKAHQDDHQKCSDLRLEAQLNFFYDNLAEAVAMDRILEGVEK